MIIRLLLSPSPSDMDVITPVISLLERLLDPVSVRVCNVVNLNEKVNVLTRDMKALQYARDDLKTRVDQAELQGLRPTNEVNGWLQAVDALEVEVHLIVDHLEQRRQCPWFCSTNSSSRYKLSNKASKLLAEIRNVKKHKEAIVSITSGYAPPAVEMIPTRPIIGQEIIKQRVQQCLEDDQVGIIGIYGMGGLGKTTLLKNINNEFLTTTHNYDVVIWVLISKDFVADKIQQAVAARLGLPWEENEDQEQRASKIHRILMRKKFLLLLDDIWEGVDLQKIGIPLPDLKSKRKVIFTTRSKDVCSDMDAHRKLKLEFLTEEESWQLFSDKTGGAEILNSPSIKPYAEVIVGKCGGLPLALITVGRTMANKETEEEWRHAVEVINKSPSELRGMEGVFTLLKFSYDNLENDVQRACFLYCSLFPEEYSVDKEQLIEYWIGEDILDSSWGTNVCGQGHAVIGSLIVACLLEPGEEKSQVKMHDLVRSFALWVASDCKKHSLDYIVQPSAGLTAAPKANLWKAAARISLLDNEITEVSIVPLCPRLLTLLLQRNSGLTRFPNGFFMHMPILRVLDLSFTSLREIPDCISMLVELRHLNLSGTKLSTVPEEIGRLSNLRHLDLQHTYFLNKIPSQAIVGLSQMQVLNLYSSYWLWEVLDSEGSNEIRLSDLEGLKHLVSLGLTVSDIASLKRLSDMKDLLKCVKYLYITDCVNVMHIELISAPGDGEILEKLTINICRKLRYLIVGNDAGKRWLPSLKELSLVDLPNLTTLWGNQVVRESLQNLRFVEIWYCHMLKEVSWALNLPRLEVLYLFYCREIEEIISMDQKVEGDSSEFPCLRVISIRDLPKLRSISRQTLAFPSLEKIAVIDCPTLKKLPLKIGGSNSSSIPTVYGKKEWWDELEWDDTSTREAFLPSFTST